MICRGIMVFIFLAFAINASAQGTPFEVPTTNTRAKIQQRIAATDIEISYGRPNVNGRAIFGALIPYEQVWRTGSDASTKISFSTPVMINSQVLDSGSYELFTIPSEKEWTIIFQLNTSQWGSYSYKQERDVLRVATQSQPVNQPVETFSMSFENITSNSGELIMAWEHTRVPIKISVDLKKTVIPKLEASLLNDERKPYFRAAMFYFENDLDINRAAELMAMALKDNPNHIGMLHRQALILEKKGDVSGAIEAAKKSLKEAESAPPELKSEYTKLNMALLGRLKK